MIHHVCCNVMCYLFSEISDGCRTAISRFAMPTSSDEVINGHNSITK